mgnify:CR=1 FL=1
MTPIGFLIYIPEAVVGTIAYVLPISYGTSLILIGALGGLLFVQIFKGPEAHTSVHSFGSWVGKWKFVLLSMLGILLIVGAINAHHDYFTPKPDNSFKSENLDL